MKTIVVHMELKFQELKTAKAAAWPPIEIGMDVPVIHQLPVHLIMAAEFPRIFFLQIPEI
jgi:hypothetical protein